MSERIVIEQKVLKRNDLSAAENRKRFFESGLLVLNVVSSPGSGKTALIEAMLTDVRDEIRCAVVVGDLQTDNDARRMRGRGAPVEQITTGTVCHLEAAMIARAIESFDLASLDVLIVENVGNLVCPASYDLGEDLRVVVLSVTEGEDKPLKYPQIFKSADVVLLNKIDLAPVVDWDRNLAINNLHRVSPRAHVYEVSARTRQGLDAWYAHVRSELARKVGQDRRSG